MNTEINKKRMEGIYSMLMEIACGNFSYRIARSGFDDQLEAIVVLLNMTVEELQQLFNHHVFLNPHKAYLYLTEMSFSLDNNFQVLEWDDRVISTLDIDPNTLQNTPFQMYLSPVSVPYWETIKEELQSGIKKQCFCQLTFCTGKQMELSALCSISVKNPTHSISVTSFSISVQEELMVFPLPKIKTNGSQRRKNPGTNHQLGNDSDLKAIQNVMNHLHELQGQPMPTLKELAHLYGINEFKLKKGFRKLFDTTPYQYYKNERLKMAKLYIEHSTYPLKRIGAMIGFKSYPSFIKAFKNEYGKTPFEFKTSLKED